MEWRLLQGFYHAARLGSFTKAAEATFRTQSALSQQIKALEEELGATLFKRTGRKRPVLTPAGEKFYEYARSVIKGFEEVREELLDDEEAGKGRLRIAAPFTTLYQLLPERIKAFADRFPNVELTLLDRPRGRAARLVREGEADLGFTLESSAPKDLNAARLWKVRTVLLVPGKHPLTELKLVTWEQLSRYPLIFPPQPGRAILEKNLLSRGLDYRAAMESSNVELSAVYVEAGLGISFATVTDNLTGLDKRNLRLIPMDHYFSPDYLVIIFKKDFVMSPYMSFFLEKAL